MQDDDCEAPLYLGVGSCHAVDSTKPKRVRRKQPIGFVAPAELARRAQPKPVAKKPQRRARKR